MGDYEISDAKLEEFKRDYCCAPGGKYNIEIQLPHLAKLADSYLNKYKRTGDWTDVLKAHTLYNSCAVRAPAIETDLWERKAFEAQMLYWGADRAWGFETQKNLTGELKEEIEGIRSNLKTVLIDVDKAVKRLDLAKIRDQQFLSQFQDDIQRMSLSCTDAVLKFAKTVFEFSVASLLVQPPCDFCVVAIGSMAKGEATPYSDLEYMFLIERDEPDVVEYFEKLAVSSYFIIGNLQETPLGYMAVEELQGWFDDKQKSGFKIDGLKDGAGNIPTGNGTSSQKNHLIVTCSTLIQNYKTVLDCPQEDAIRGDLTAKLQYTKPVYYNQEQAKKLLERFCEQKNLLQPNEERQKANTDMFISDSKKYGFKPTEELINKGFSINTKRELYRYPSILLYNLSIIFDSSKQNSWETLESLSRNGSISHSIFESISFLLACACYFRLSTYLFYDSADDRLSVLPASYFSATEHRTVPQVIERYGKRWFLSQRLFNLHCDHSVPLKRHFGKCQTHVDIKEFGRMEIQQPNWLVKFQTLHCCNRWSKSQSHIEEHIGKISVLKNPEHTIREIYNLVDHDFHELWNSVKALTYSLCEIRKDEEALSYHLIIQRMIEAGEGPESYKEQQLIMADSKGEAADCYYGLTRYEEAAIEYASSLEIRSHVLPANHELLAKMHFCIGRSYNMMYNYKKAEAHLSKALQLCYNQASVEVVHNYYGEVIHLGECSKPLIGLLKKSPEERLRFLNNPTKILAHVLWTLGLNYFYTKRYLRASCYFDKSKSMFFELYGMDACHRDITHILYALACAKSMVGDHVAADMHFWKGINMTIQLYGKGNRFRASVLHFLTKGTNSTVKIKLVFKAFTSLSRYRTAHAQSATALNRFGLHLVSFKQHELANFILSYTLRAFRQSSTELKYSSGYISNTISHLALNQWQRGDFVSAEKLYIEALDELKEYEELFPTPAALERGEILQSMGRMYEIKQYHNRALECFNEAQSNFSYGCDSHNHPKIIEVEQQIRTVISNIQSG